MKSGGPWNLRGLHPDAREAARTAARRSGMSVGEWLNDIIQPDDSGHDAQSLAPDAGNEAEDRGPPRRQNDDREPSRDSGPRRPRDFADDEEALRFTPAESQPEQRGPAPWQNKERAQNKERGQNKQREHNKQREQRHDRGPGPRQLRDFETSGEALPRFIHAGNESPDRGPAPWQNKNREHRRDRDARVQQRDRERKREIEQAKNRVEAERTRIEEERSRIEQEKRRVEQEKTLANEAIREAQRIREEARETARHEGRREAEKNREELGSLHGRLDKLSQQLERMVRIDAAPRRQEPPPQSPSSPSPPPGIDAPVQRLTGAPTRHRASSAASQMSIDDAVAEIAARQRALNGGDRAAKMPRAEMPIQRMPEAGDNTPPAAFVPPQPAPDASDSPPNTPQAEIVAQNQMPETGDSAPEPAVAESAPAPRAAAPEPAIDLSGLERQLRDITARIEALRPSSDLEASVSGIRSDLSEITRLITEALPRHAVESLEIEIKALGQRIEHSRQCGFEASAIAGLERGLAEVREALRELTPAESLVGFNDAVKALSHKVDMIVAKDDPAALEQLETAIGALRGVVSHVASNETLSKVADDVRSLAAKVDNLASATVSGRDISALETRIETLATASGQDISALENRIEALANALAVSSEAGHAVPRELEKLLSGLIEKLEWVQLTHTDHAALAHLEDRIATLVQRFDASAAQLGHLEAVERGIADLLVHIEDIRSLSRTGEPKRMPAVQNPVPVHSIERDVAEIKQSELRTQDSLEAVHGTVEHVVDRLAKIESGIRETRVPPVLQPMDPVQQPAVAEPDPTLFAPEPVAPPAAATMPATLDTAPSRSAAARNPIDPNLPPDHPLEPGSALNRSRTPSAADRIAASEAAIGPAKPPVIADPGDKPNFIAAARRAAMAAAATPSQQSDAKAAGKGFALPKLPKQRTRTLIVATAAALILIGGIQIASRFFEDGNSSSAPPAPQAQPEQAAPPAAALPEPAQPAPPPPAAAPTPAPNAPTGAEPAPAPLPNPKSGANPATDITGSLPHPALAASTPAGPANASLGDKLPAAIGGPALRTAALSGDAAAAYEVGMRFSEGRGVTASYQDAALWLERAAKQGLAPAQFRLGGFYEKGLGVKKDLATARDLYMAAANKGNGKAMHNLAVLYAEGIDGPADYADASHWFREAADHGLADSQYNLGILYARGIGVAQNFAESYKWFALAANQGDADAAKKREEVAGHLDAQSLAAARQAVKTWTAVPQPDDAINVKAPPGGWDSVASAAPVAKPKPRPTAAKASGPDTKLD